jgi:uncharacterized membrane protein
MTSDRILEKIKTLSNDELNKVENFIVHLKKNNKEESKKQLIDWSKEGLYNLPIDYKFNRDDLHEG